MPRWGRIARGCAWPFASRRRMAACLFVVLFAGANLLAVFHARAMTTFSTGGSRTDRPESLSPLQKARILLAGVNLPRPVNEKSPKDFGLAYETHRIRGQGDVELEAWQVPCRDPRATVLMFHGYASCKARLLHEARELNALDCETLLVDFRGSGGSSGNETTLGVYEADDVAASLKFARPLAGARPLILYGRSMGSAAILRAVAAQGVEPDAVILECPFDRLLSTVENRFSAMGVPVFPMAPLLVFWGGVLHDMNGFAHNPVDYAASVRCPALLMHGRRDPRVSVAQVRSICAKLSGEKRLALFPRAGHESYLAIDPESWRRTIEEFLDRVERGEGGQP